MRLIAYLRFCWRIWRAAPGVHYIAETRYGVPQFTALIGTGRHAWEVTQLAIERRFTIETPKTK
jgi:hypothetical protein